MTFCFFFQPGFPDWLNTSGKNFDLLLNIAIWVNQSSCLVDTIFFVAFQGLNWKKDKDSL